MTNECCVKMEGKNIGLCVCFGGSSTGQMTGFIARELNKKSGAGIMCLLGFVPNLKPVMDKLNVQDIIIGIDGCPVGCVKKTLEMINVAPDRYYDLVKDFGIEKEPKLDFNEEEMNKVVDKIINDIKEL